MEGDERAFVNIGRHILAYLSAISEASVASDLVNFFKKTFRTEYLVKLGRGAVAAGDDKDGVGVLWREFKMYSTCVLLIAQLVVHVDYVECALVVNYIVISLFYQRKRVLPLEDQWFIVLLKLCILNRLIRYETLLNALCKHNRVLTVIYAL